MMPGTITPTISTLDTPLEVDPHPRPAPFHCSRCGRVIGWKTTIGPQVWLYGARGGKWLGRGEVPCECGAETSWHYVASRKKFHG
jgi:hypothetical protein